MAGRWVHTLLSLVNHRSHTSLDRRWPGGEEGRGWDWAPTCRQVCPTSCARAAGVERLVWRSGRRCQIKLLKWHHLRQICCVQWWTWEMGKVVLIDIVNVVNKHLLCCFWLVGEGDPQALIAEGKVVRGGCWVGDTLALKYCREGWEGILHSSPPTANVFSTFLLRIGRIR